MKKRNKTSSENNKNEIWVLLKKWGYLIPILIFVFWAGWYTHSNLSSIEFHEKEMQLYNLHQQQEDRYKNEIRQLEYEKRELEKELYEIRQIKNSERHD